MKLLHGDCLDALKQLDDNSVHSVVTDPPYGLAFMNKKWDYDVPSVDIWREVLRVLRPGGHLLSFGGTRTYHRMVVNIEDAGFEIRDQIQWIYGSGFPKSHNIGKAIDKAFGAKRKVIGQSKNGAGNKPIDGLIGSASDSQRITVSPIRQREGKDTFKQYDITEPATKLAQQWDGWGTALKPANEPICLARKPLDGTVADNIEKWGVGGLNIDGCRIGTDKIESGRHGRKECESESFGEKLLATEKKFKEGHWPANLMFDEFAAEQLGEPSRFFYVAKASKRERNEGLEGMPEQITNDGRQKEIDNAYQRGITKRQNHHPTVKPVKLMEYLCKLITPPNGIVLDPFMGSGSTGIAALNLGFEFIGIEKELEYLDIATKRIKHGLRA